jgi:hypothetical protein
VTGGVACSVTEPTVSAPLEQPASITLDEDVVVLQPEESFRIGVTVRSASGDILSGVVLRWLSSDTLAAVVDPAGVVTGLGAGRARVTASAGDLEAAIDVRVVGISPSRPLLDGQGSFWMLPNRWSELLVDPDGWPSVRNRIHVAKFFPWWFDDVSDETLLGGVSLLNQAHVAIAVEVGALREWECDGANTARMDLVNLGKIDAAGGAVTFVVIDDPYGYTMERANPQGCGYSAEEVSVEILEWMQAVRAAHPHIRFGLTEPVPWFHVGPYPNHPGNDFGDLLALVDTLMAVLATGGERIEFFQADSPYDWTELHPAGWEKLLLLELELRRRGISFSLIYNSEAGGTTSDEAYYVETLAALDTHWSKGGRSDHLVVQSWYPMPSRMGPETEAFTFANLMRDFMTRAEELTAGTPGSRASPR